MPFKVSFLTQESVAAIFSSASYAQRVFYMFDVFMTVEHFISNFLSEMYAFMKFKKVSCVSFLLDIVRVKKNNCTPKKWNAKVSLNPKHMYIYR